MIGPDDGLAAILATALFLGYVALATLGRRLRRRVAATRPGRWEHPT